MTVDDLIAALQRFRRSQPNVEITMNPHENLYLGEGVAPPMPAEDREALVSLGFFKLPIFSASVRRDPVTGGMIQPDALLDEPGEWAFTA